MTPVLLKPCPTDAIFDSAETPVNCPHCGQMCPGRAAVTAPAFYPASRRRKLHIPRFRRKRRKLDHSAASPLPTEPASLGFGGSPVLSSVNPPESGSKSLSGAGTLPRPEGGHTTAHRGEHGGSSACSTSCCCTRCRSAAVSARYS